MMTWSRMIVIGVALATATSAPAQKKPAPTAKPTTTVPRPDLADRAAGTYYGDVISDARGSSQSDVTITVVKVAPGTVRVSSSYARLPAFTTNLTRAMNTIQQTGGDPTKVFLLDLAKSPNHLDVTVDDASWSGDRQ